MNRENKPILVAITSMLSVLALFAMVFYVMLVELDVFSSVVIAVACLGLIVPAAIYAESFLDFFTALVEVFAEGVSAIFSSIADMISSLFG